MPPVGAIADRIKGIIPITWDALSGDPRVGDQALQAAIDLAKEMVTGINVTPQAEQNYPLIAVDYMAKVAALELVPAGIDFWMNQSISVSSSGTNESIAYTDRARVLEDLRTQLLEETRTKQAEVSKIVGYWLDNGRAVPQMSTANINPFHLTPSPEEFPRKSRQTQYS